jgi:hypothetical protein
MITKEVINLIFGEMIESLISRPKNLEQAQSMIMALELTIEGVKERFQIKDENRTSTIED